MSVWLTIPSKRTPEECGPMLAKWRERGYRIALWVDTTFDLEKIGYDHWICGRYPGYAKACNALIADVMIKDDSFEWAVVAGDDIEPDPNHTAEEIARECRFHFDWNAEFPRCTFGVMQPTGDRYGEQPNHPNPAMRSAYADRVCGSAWIGREFAKRMYGGNGPLWPEYFHMGCDEELQHVALKYGVLWQRRDLTQYHHHWARKRGSVEDRPAFLERASGPEEWAKYKALFEARKAAGFPGSEPL